MAARAMEEIESEFGLEAELIDVGIVVAIRTPDEAEHVRIDTESDGVYPAVGLFSLALDVAKSGKEPDE